MIQSAVIFLLDTKQGVFDKRKRDMKAIQVIAECQILDLVVERHFAKNYKKQIFFFPYCGFSVASK